MFAMGEPKACIPSKSQGNPALAEMHDAVPVFFRMMYLFSKSAKKIWIPAFAGMSDVDAACLDKSFRRTPDSSAGE
ncbi:MAG: hypothetical protein EA399_10380 [Desulfovibrionales bacterium]|nr:MAG: hypothetical protein EA399_10380 [Desulfovibrionales bacterium]